VVRVACFEPAKPPEISGDLDNNAQGDAQRLVPLSHDLAQVVIAWSKLPPLLKAAILAIVGSVTSSPEVEP